MARLADPQSGERIYDPTCGSGSLLLKCAALASQDGKTPPIYGQEQNGSTFALARMNMFLHGIDDARIQWGDTIRNPLHLENDKLLKSEIVVANPPFSLDKWGIEEAAHDPHGRFTRGLPPRSKGDYAFILHMLVSLSEREGAVCGAAPGRGVTCKAAKQRGFFSPPSTAPPPFLLCWCAANAGRSASR